MKIRKIDIFSEPNQIQNFIKPVLGIMGGRIFTLHVNEGKINLTDTKIYSVSQRVLASISFVVVSAALFYASPLAAVLLTSMSIIAAAVAILSQNPKLELDGTRQDALVDMKAIINDFKESDNIPLFNAYKSLRDLENDLENPITLQQRELIVEIRLDGYTKFLKTQLQADVIDLRSLPGSETDSLLAYLRDNGFPKAVLRHEIEYAQGGTYISAIRPLIELKP